MNRNELLITSAKTALHASRRKRSASITVSVLLSVLAAAMSGYAADVPKNDTITLTDLRGKWQGATNGTQCIVEFSSTNDVAKIHSFKGDKHMSTVLEHYSLSSSKDRVFFVVNGEVLVLKDKQLLLKLRAVNERIFTVRDVILSKKSGD